MLHDFINDNREYILGKCNSEMAKMAGAKEISVSMRGDWTTFLDQLGELLDVSTTDFSDWKATKGSSRSAQNSVSPDRPKNGKPEIPVEVQEQDILEPTAARRGQEYLRMGYTLSDVVHAYGIVCQAVTNSAAELKYRISSEEFGRLNLALDIAIAAAVTQYEKVKIEVGKTDELQRLGFLAHELRNALTSAFIALELVESGDVGARGQTGKVLNRSLQSMKMLIDSALLAVRMKVEPQAHLEWVDVLQVASEIEVTAAVEARQHVIGFKISVEPGLSVFADRQHFVSALANLLQNAVKFSHPGSIVEIRGTYKDHRAYIEIEDRCGGLPKAKLDALFKPFEQMSDNKSGLGLGLTISRRAIELSDGSIYARDLPGKGCVFTIELTGRIGA